MKDAVADRVDVKLHALERRVLDGPGQLAPALRRAASEGSGLPAELAAFTAKVREHPTRVTDEDVQVLHAAGYSDDEIFELTIAAAVGASMDRWRAGLRALGQGEDRRHASPSA
jgi:alkylhydroperoxidase family enzyme